MMAKKRKRRNSDKGATHLPIVVKDSIKTMFKRQFVYTFEMPQSLPQLSGMQNEWEIPAHIEMKDELNTLKNNLNDKNMLTWHDHTRAVNIAGSIAQQIRAKFRPELCTQAWCKFYEIASVYLEVNTDIPFYSVHLCEAPGAFVTSLNQYLLSIGYQGNWDWLATTLNPYYEGNSIGQMIDDDRFIHCSHGNWYFGSDGTGNLMSKENLSGLQHKLQDVKVDLVTADGSIDCQGDPAEQENFVSRLQYCEVITALHILSTSGTLVVKMFTMFECKAISLMYILNCAFESVNVFKPCTSKGGNSEVYVISKGYKGKASCESYLTWLTEVYFGDKDSEGCILAQSDIPITFLNQHTQCAEFFKDCQMTSIQRNLDLYKVRTEVERSQLEQEREYCMECFLSNYHIETMINKERIMKPARWNRPCRSDGARPIIYSGEKADRVKMEGKFTGSFLDRQLQTQLPWKQKVLHYETYEAEVDKEDNSLWIKSMLGPLNDREVDMFAVQYGKRVDKIHSSRFCHNFYIAKTTEIIDNAQWLKSPIQTSQEFIEIVVNQLVTVLSVALGYRNQEKEITHLNQSTSENGNHSLGLKNQPADSKIDWSEMDVSVNKSCGEYLEIDKSSSNEIEETGNAGIQQSKCNTTTIESGDKNDPKIMKSELDENVTTPITVGDGSNLAQCHLTLGQFRTKDVTNRGISTSDCESVKELKKVSNGNSDYDDKEMDTSSAVHNDEGFKSVSNGPHLLHGSNAAVKDKKNEFASKNTTPSASHEISDILGDTEMDTTDKETISDKKQTTESSHKANKRVDDGGVSIDKASQKLHRSNEKDDELLHCEVKCNCIDGHSKFCQQLSNKTKRTGDIVRFYTVCQSHEEHGMELSDQRSLCQVVMEIIKICSFGDTVVIEMGTSLTRITAGLVYILYRSFSEVGFMHYHGNLLKRHLVCTSYQHCPISLHQCLSEACHQLNQCDTEAVLEILPVYILLDDADFTSFLHISNTNLLQSFITTVINKERQLCV